MDAKFYSGGLRFECTRCSNCCRHEPGYVFLTASDVKHIAKATKTSKDQVIEKFCRTVRIGVAERLSLQEKENFDCIFWEEDGCIIYKHRPVQCKTYPFWSANIISQEVWDQVGKSCPGVNQGPLYTKDEIEYIASLREKEPYLP